MMAVGVANPRAHGQAITITAVKAMSAKDNVDPAIKYQPRPVNSATMITAGTNQDEI
ncbi:MAG: hypothetical protein ACD_28C00314G0001 [uncultured bacterium]|nr:MAG: hypothetical protein ACD_28C00314G0001 [uncultured bacterium]